MKTIDLEEIFNNNFNCCYAYDTKDEEIAMTKSKFKEVVFEICKTVLELAAENAEVVSGFKSTGEYSGHSNWYVDKETILGTINQIK